MRKHKKNNKIGRISRIEERIPALDEKKCASFGKLKGTVHEMKNIIQPVDEVWSVFKQCL